MTKSLWHQPHFLKKKKKMLCIHEVAETLIGNITPFDGITPEKKKEIEQQAMFDALVI